MSIFTPCSQNKPEDGGGGAADDPMAEYEAEERDREDDIKERDAFVKRLLDRDSEATKKTAPSGRGSSRLEEDLKRLERGEVVRQTYSPFPFSLSMCINSS